MKFHVISLATGPSSFAEFEPQTKPERTEPPRCESCGTKLSPLLRVAPHRYQVKNGKTGDLLTDGMVFAVSEQFRTKFEASELTGLSFSDEPIGLKGCDEKFYMAYPEITRTLLDEAASGVVIDDLRGCDECRVMATTKIDRVVLREDTWPGCDVFMMGNLFGVILATERFVEFVNANGFTNYQFIDQSEYHEDFSFQN